MKRKPLTTVIDPKLAKDIKDNANSKGMKLYVVFEEAISDYLKKEK